MVFMIWKHVELYVKLWSLLCRKELLWINLILGCRYKNSSKIAYIVRQTHVTVSLFCIRYSVFAQILSNYWVDLGVKAKRKQDATNWETSWSGASPLIHVGQSGVCGSSRTYGQTYPQRGSLSSPLDIWFTLRRGLARQTLETCGWACILNSIFWIQTNLKWLWVWKRKETKWDKSTNM